MATWSEALHPRGPNGKFIAKGGSEAYSAARAAVKDALAGGKGPDQFKKLVGHLSTLTVKQLTELKAEYGIKASGVKAQIVDKLAARLGEKSGPAAGKVVAKVAAAQPAAGGRLSAADAAAVYDAAGSTAKQSEVNSALRSAADMPAGELAKLGVTMGVVGTGPQLRAAVLERIEDRRGGFARRAAGAGISPEAQAEISARYKATLDEPPITARDALADAGKAAKARAKGAADRAPKASTSNAVPPTTAAGKAVVGIYQRAASASAGDVAAARNHLAAMPTAERARVAAAVGMAGKPTAPQILARITDRRGAATRRRLIHR